MNPTSKEEFAIILDFLPNGHPMDPRPMFKKTPIAQALGKEYFILLELIPKKDIALQPHEEVYIGDGKRDKIHHILGKIPTDKLTETAKGELNFVIEDLVSKNEQKFIAFFNNSGPISTRRHQIELLPGIGQKHMWEILEARKEKPFTNFDDIKARVKLIPDPRKLIVKRIIAEINEADKFKLFTR